MSCQTLSKKVTIIENGTSNKYPVAMTSNSPEKLIVDDDSLTLTPGVPRFYLTKPNTSPTPCVTNQYQNFILMGKTISCTVDASKVGCGNNLAFYAISMPGNPQSAGTMSAHGDFYCDANKADNSVYCPELDLIECNVGGLHSTLHGCVGVFSSNKSDGVFSNCDGSGEALIFNPNYGYNKTGSGNINTKLPFDIIWTLTETSYTTIISQDSTKITKSINWSNVKYGDNIKEATRRGMVLCFSLWSGDMDWLDGGCKDLTTLGNGIFRNITINDNGTKPTPHSGCTSTSCGKYGICKSDGTCDCLYGYTGSDCSTIPTCPSTLNALTQETPHSQYKNNKHILMIIGIVCIVLALGAVGSSFLKEVQKNKNIVFITACILGVVGISSVLISTRIKTPNTPNCPPCKDDEKCVKNEKDGYKCVPRTQCNPPCTGNKICKNGSCVNPPPDPCASLNCDTSYQKCTKLSDGYACVDTKCKIPCKSTETCTLQPDNKTRKCITTSCGDCSSWEKCSGQPDWNCKQFTCKETCPTGQHCVQKGNTYNCGGPTPQKCPDGCPLHKICQEQSDGTYKCIQNECNKTYDKNWQKCDASTNWNPVQIKCDPSTICDLSWNKCDESTGWQCIQTDCHPSCAEYQHCDKSDPNNMHCADFKCHPNCYDNDGNIKQGYQCNVNNGVYSCDQIDCIPKCSSPNTCVHNGDSWTCHTPSPSTCNPNCDNDEICVKDATGKYICVPCHSGTRKYCCEVCGDTTCSDKDCIACVKGQYCDSSSCKSGPSPAGDNCCEICGGQYDCGATKCTQCKYPCKGNTCPLPETGNCCEVCGNPYYCAQGCTQCTGSGTIVCSNPGQPLGKCIPSGGGGPTPPTPSEPIKIPAGNPFSLKTNYLAINPHYVDEIKSAKDLTQAQVNALTQPVAFWIDSIQHIQSGPPGQDLKSYLDAAIDTTKKTSKKVTATFIVYDLPNRDCHASASNGEICCDGNPPDPTTGKCGDISYMMNECTGKSFSPDDSSEYPDIISLISPATQGDCTKGINKYKTEYIDPLFNLLKKYKDLDLVAIIEPDSLPNMITNLCTRNCSLLTKQAYIEGITYALNKLGQLDNITMYLDISHGGWLGWCNAPKPSGTDFAVCTDADGTGNKNSIQAYVNLIKNVFDTLNPGIDEKVRGFATNTSNYQPLGWKDGKRDDNDYCNLSSQYNFAWNELRYINMINKAFKQVGIKNKTFITDTGRNGDPSIRPGTTACQQWCNIKGKIGISPTDDTQDFSNTAQAPVDAFFWLKNVIESDGCSPGTYEDGTIQKCTRVDSMCTRDCDKPWQLCPAPEAGQSNSRMARILVGDIS